MKGKGASCRSSAPVQALLGDVRGQELLPGSSWSEADPMLGMERRVHSCLASFVGGKKGKKKKKEKKPCCILYTSFLLTFICNTMKKHLCKPKRPAFLELGQPPPATYGKKAPLLLHPFPLSIPSLPLRQTQLRGKGRGDPLRPGSGHPPLCSAVPALSDPVSHNLPWQTRPRSPDGLRARQRGTAPDSNPSRQIEGTRARGASGGEGQGKGRECG